MEGGGIGDAGLVGAVGNERGRGWLRLSEGAVLIGGGQGQVRCERLHGLPALEMLRLADAGGRNA